VLSDDAFVASVAPVVLIPSCVPVLSLVDLPEADLSKSRDSAGDFSSRRKETERSSSVSVSSSALDAIKPTTTSHARCAAASRRKLSAPGKPPKEPCVSSVSLPLARDAKEDAFRLLATTSSPLRSAECPSSRVA
jgi:hypothetical protein